MDQQMLSPPRDMPLKMLKCLLCSAYIFGAIIPLAGAAAEAADPSGPISILPYDIPVTSSWPTGRFQSSEPAESVTGAMEYYSKSPTESSDARTYYNIQSSMTFRGPNAMTMEAGPASEMARATSADVTTAPHSMTAEAPTARSVIGGDFWTLGPESASGSSISPLVSVGIMELVSRADQNASDNGSESSNYTGGVTSGTTQDDQPERRPQGNTTPAITPSNDVIYSPQRVMENAVYSITFIGNCSILQSNQSIEENFIGMLIKRLQQQLKFNGTQLEITNLTCDDLLTLEVTILNVTREENITFRLVSLINNEKINISLDYNGTIESFVSKNISMMYSPPLEKRLQTTDEQTEALPATFKLVTTALPLSVPEDASYKIIFIGNCSIVKSNKSVENEFSEQVALILYSNLGIGRGRIKIRDVLCGSVAVEITIRNTTREEDLDKRIEDLIVDGELVVRIDYNNETLEFEAEALEVISSPTWKSRSTLRPTSVFVWDNREIWRRKEPDLTGLHIALILVFSVIGGSIIMFGVGFGLYFCCTRSRSKSFNLAADTAPQLASMEDFTLTKMERPKPIYTDAGIILQTDIDDSQVKAPMMGTSNGRGYTGYDGGRALKATKNHNGHFPKSASPGRSNARALGRRATPAPIKGLATRNDGSAERLVFTELSADKLSGYDNPSFSSDELLLDGEETGPGTLPGGSPRRETRQGEEGEHYSTSATGSAGKRRAISPVAKKSLAVQQEKRSVSPSGQRSRPSPIIPAEGATAL